MRETITVSLPSGVSRRLNRLVRGAHASRSDVVRRALLQFFLREEFARLRERALPYAIRKGIFADEDVFKRVS